MGSWKTIYLFFTKKAFLTCGWKPFKAKLMNSERIGQHIESEKGHYVFDLNVLVKHGISILIEIIEDLNKHKEIISTNAGIIGGSNIDFFQVYTERAF